jgi:endo-1,4-beta-xylanase
MQRRALLFGLGASASVTPVFQASAPRSLRAVAAERNIRFGSELTCADLDADPAYGALIARECAIVTPGIEAKWGYTEPQEGKFRFQPMDRIAAFAARNGLMLHMHNLIWSVGLPKWTIAGIADGREAVIMAHHIAALVGRYQDQVESWDVVNEPADPRWPSGPEGLCRTPWRNGLGPGYVGQSLIDAHASNRKVRLLINDDDLEYDLPDREKKRSIYLHLIATLLRDNIPLHGFGLEAHLKPWLTIAEIPYRRFLHELGDFGLSIYVTELDVCDKTLGADIPARDHAVASMTKRYLDLALDEPATQTVITWGLSDRTTWMVKDPSGQRRDGLPPRPLPYDSDLKPKPMRAALLAAFAHARDRVTREPNPLRRSELQP